MSILSQFKMRKARHMLLGAERVFVLTGAGISVASGIPSFRGKDGLYNKPDFFQWAFPESHIQDPVGGWRAFEMARMAVGHAEPNPAHEALAAFARQHRVELFTQNVDGLHASSGESAKEIHGSLHRYRCQKSLCAYLEDAPRETESDLRYCPVCGTVLRHDVVLFGESVRFFTELREAVLSCDVVLLIGTSGVVTDTAMLARLAKSHGKKVVEVDPALFTRATCWTSVSVRENAESALPFLLS